MSFFPSDEEQTQDVKAEINLTPLIDIMLVLLIIFMVTSSISLESGLDIDLPSTKSQTQKQPSNAVIISLDKDANIFVQGNKVTMDSIGEAIAKALKEASTKLVVFEGDRASRLGKANEIIDLAKAAGATKFAIATDEQ
ncbi:MAG: ExbD/TolR family protein [Bacteriovoracia bacterium]